MFAPDGGAIVRGGAIKAHRGVLSTTVALIAVAGFGAPAVAATAAPVSVNASGGTAPTDEAPVEGEPVEGEYDEDLPLPDEPPEVKFPDDEPDMPDGLECKPGWFFKITKNKKNTMSVKYRTFVENKKNYTIEYKFTSKKSGTTEVGASVAVSADIGVKILGSIKAEIQASAKKSWTSEIGIETYGKVKAKSTVKGNYGISKENVYGYKYYRGSACQKSNKQYMTAWAPYREGWVVS
ncbi:hypothetical protein KUG12_23425 [Streptomyces sp. BV333]|uniref:hypothetical protein n=1 Tax=Streptomyces sp. BV333 TaxID=2849673 RepID=UPI001C2E98CB|nr:hypothetical protein [Streptomyces sp. BV333]MBV1957257.1 hypothetical protein [Streptomyces sp. BV333]